VIELTEAEGSVLLVVADDGPGIPPEQRKWVFDRFARIDEARSLASGGSGLGLAITREIVMAHGGTIEIADATQGARFVVSLPASAGDLDDRPVGFLAEESLQ
jgi:signal transduction histidine kinase